MSTTITLGAKSYTLIVMPSAPAKQAVQWKMNDVVGINVSPFTLQQQTYNWGQAQLAGTVIVPAMYPDLARPWVAFMAACHGKSRVFQVGDGKMNAPSGTGGAGSVVGSNQTGNNLLTSFTTGAVLPGTWIQIGYRMYVVESNSSGALEIWPNLRESPADGDSIVTVNPKGLFRLASNQRSYNYDPDFYRFSFDVEEAL